MTIAARISGTVLGSLVIACVACSDVGAPEQDEGRAAQIKAFWAFQLELIESLPGGIFSQHNNRFSPKLYPAESAISFISAWRVTGDERYRAAAVRQLQFSRDLELPSSLFPMPDSSLISTNGQARAIVGYWIASRVLGDGYLDWADDAADGLLTLARGDACWQDTCEPVFWTVYDPQTRVPAASRIFFNPNQQAVIGLALTLLYFDRRSRHLGNASVAAIAREHLRAAASMITGDGRLGLSAYDDADSRRYDTRYGHYTFFKLYWANQYWEDPVLEAGLERASQWVRETTMGGPQTSRFYPDRVIGEMPDPIELYHRFPLVRGDSLALAALEAGLDRQWAGWERFRELRGGLVAPHVVFELIGLDDPDF